MRHKVQILLMLSAFLLLFFLSCKKAPSKILNDIRSHNLKIKLIPDEHKLIAIDTLQIEYREQSNSLYFFLHQSLQIEKVCVGKQKLTYQIISPKKFNNHLFNKIHSTNTVHLYEVNLPKSLFPQYIQIWYQGVLNNNEKIAGSRQNSGNVTAEQQCCINQNRINLPGKNFWYPCLPECKSVYKLTSLTPAGLPVITAGSLIFHEQRNDSLISIWEHKVPVHSISLTAENPGVNNSSLDQFGSLDDNIKSYSTNIGKHKKTEF